MALSLRRYVNTINVDQPCVGSKTGSALTTGSRNLLLGANAGSKLTTGSNNVIVGSYTALNKETMQNNVVLSDGDGKAVFHWNPSASLTMSLGVFANAPPPAALVEGTTSISFDTNTKAVIFDYKYNDAVYRSFTVNKALVDSLFITAEDTNKVGGVPATTLVNQIQNLALASTNVGTSIIKTGMTLRGLQTTQAGLSVAASATGDTVELTHSFGDAAGATGTSLIADANALKVRTLSAGAGISFNQTANNIEIRNTGATGSTTITLATLGNPTANSVDLVAPSGGIAPDLRLRRLIGGAGISLTSDNNTVTIAPNITLTSETGGVSLVSSGTLPEFKTKVLEQGAGIELTETTTAITIKNTGQTGTPITLSHAGPAGSKSLIAGNTSPAFLVCGLAAGTGIGIDVDNTTNLLTIKNTAVAGSVTLASTAAEGADLVNDGEGPTLAVKRLKAGAGMIIKEDSTVALALHNARTFNATIRPSDVLRVIGQLQVVPVSVEFSPPTAMWAPAIAFGKMQFQALRYAQTTGVVHSGTFLASLYGLPANAALNYGFDMDFTIVCPNNFPGYAFSVVITIPVADVTGVGWRGVTITSTLNVPTFSVTDGDPYPKTVPLGNPSTSVPSRTCLDTVSRPQFTLFPGETMMPSAYPVAIQLTGSGILPHTGFFSG